MPDGGGSLWLARAVGMGRALELLLTGERIDAARALEWGLTNRVVTADELRATTAALAATLAKGPPLAYAHIKRAVRAAHADLDQALEREKRGQLELLQSQDFGEGLGAFIMKREPNFVGK
jgi:enoyl-CoA hydratase/carnithine racemase